MVNVSTSAFVAAAVAALVVFFVRFNANRQHVRKLQAANAVRLHRGCVTVIMHSFSAQIHASLSEWKTGYHKKSFFSADAFLDAYEEHQTILKGILKNHAPAYHCMMHRLFSEAR